MMKRAASILLTVLTLASCSTTRVLDSGQYRLAKNNVTVEGDPAFKLSEVSPYIKQQPNSYIAFGWNPFLNIYNWAGDSDRGIDRILKKIGAAPVVYDAALADASVKSIRDHLEYIGYYGSEVSSETVTKRKLARVNYRIRLGKRFPIDSIKYSIPQEDGFAGDFSANLDNSLIKKGKYLSEKDLETESSRSASFMRNRGFYDFSKSNYFFTADTLSYPGKALLEYQIRGYSRNESEQQDAPILKYKFGKVSISMPEDLKFREDRLRRLNLIRSGDCYNDDIINATYARFSSLKVFSSADIVVTPYDSSRTVDCNIRLRQAQPKGIKLNLEASTSSNGFYGISPQIGFYHKNLFHGGELFNLGLTGNFQSKPSASSHANEFGVSMGLDLPHPLLGIYGKSARNIPHTVINTSFNYQDRPEYVRTMISLAVGQSGTIRNKISYQITPIRINAVRMNNLDDTFEEILNKNPLLRYGFQDHVNAGISASFTHRTSTDVVPKGSYGTSRVALDLSGNVLNLFNSLLKKNIMGEAMLFGMPYAQYMRSEFSVAGALNFGKGGGQSIAGRLFAGIGFAYGNSTVIPYEEQFYCGGAGSMRGWNARSLGPGAVPPSEIFIIPSQTGNFKLEADIEYRFRMFWKLEGAIFGEVGNIWNSENVKEFYKTLAADWGAGLRVNLDLILLRLDLGVKLYDPSITTDGERLISPDKWFKRGGFAIHFGVGYPF